MRTQFLALAIVHVMASSASAWADEKTCGAGIDENVRNALADAYSCDLRGHRCVDGHNGRAFVKASDDKAPGGYIEGDKYYEPGIPGTRIQINVFAVGEDCAEERLGGLVFSTMTIDNPDSKQEGTPQEAKTGGDE